MLESGISEQVSKQPDKLTVKTEIVTVISPAKGWISLGIVELWSYRDLLYQLATRDFRARYKQSLLGKLWVVAQPLMMMAIYYVIFGIVLKIRTGATPYPLFLLAGVIMWQLFSSSANAISISLTSNAHLVNKVYFPRLLIPLAASLASLVDFSFAFTVLLAIIALLGTAFSWPVLLCPIFVLLAALAGMTVGLWFAPLNVAHRDVQQLVPLLLQTLMYVSPVLYSPEVVPEHWRKLYYLNPLAGIVQGFRWALLNDTRPPLWSGWGVLGMVVLFWGGLYYFRRNEAELADRL